MIDNEWRLLGTIVSKFKIKNQGETYESYEFQFEVETGSTANKNNILILSITPDMLDKNAINPSCDYTGTQMMMFGIVKGSTYTNKQTKELSCWTTLVIKELKVINTTKKQQQTQSQTSYYTPSQTQNVVTNSGTSLGTNTSSIADVSDEIEITEDMLPF